ncbi:Uip5p CYBJADRAFT_95069 [Cyberlindnera jadinii NRRL Y-1542]|uniref:L-type lectin-like domain-containing protein n=1 Tax=Cyberlindnera jadinii (strain ATCC 18201 / CBS 1600 / BCRC 20928 / JCM 3617 / NBRC 0987 / NRRL Y-1542) TaxID=983966 RepID=A0A1E4S0H8_CYBJN|nr:hypothetical protein CYBJADRAFT_95069 [Cyberlindnera jadinii NRRL Y-1542]ODV72996.1 hypothetical protein CYBJADRAFT_95069 [Cyberlindnera jadinii NRRL Y-1542]
MSAIGVVKRDRRVQVGVLLLAVYILYLIFYPSSKSGSWDVFSAEEINDLLSGSNSESDIEKLDLEDLALEKPYYDSSLGYDNNWKVYGDTVVDMDKYVRLTSELKDQSSLIFNKHSFSDLGFEVDFRFHIHGSVASNGLKGDGMALFLTDKPLKEGPVFGAEDKFNGLAVFFDTYRNAPKGKVFPFINVMNGDGATRYDKGNDGKANQLAGCTARAIYNPVNGYVDARLIHTTQDGYLSLDYRLDEEWINCFSIKDVHIPSVRFMGFGASTGDLTENVDLIEARVSQLLHHGKIVQSFEEFADDEAHESEEVSSNNEQTSKNNKRRPRKQRNESQRSRLRAKLRNKSNRLTRFKDNSGADEKPSFLRTLWWLIKTSFFMLCALIVLYIAFTVYRVKRRSYLNKKRHTGLLD